MKIITASMLFSFLIASQAASQLHAQDQSIPQGAAQQTWYGKMETPGRHFRFVVELQKSPKWTGKLISLDEGRQAFEIADVEFTNSTFAFALPQTKARYEGQIKEGAIAGKWIQSGREFDLAFEKVDLIPDEQLSAVWTGTINILIQKVDVQIRELESGAIYLDSITQKIGGFVANKSVDGKKISIEVPALKASFTGELNQDGNEMNGTWKQGLFSPSLKLTKKVKAAEIVAEAPQRPQTPKAPFPYKVIDVTFQNEAADVTLAGTITLPDSANKDTLVPGVVLVSGSGPQDRDESISEHKPFWVIADYFSKRGIAVLRYDDRGTANSTGDFSAATSVDLAGDARCAVEFLQSFVGVDKTKVGIVGHSEGGLIAPMVAADTSSIPFVVLMAGPGVNGEEILVSQTALILKASGMPQDDIARESKIQQELIALAKIEPRLSGAEFNARARRVIEQNSPESIQAEDIDAIVNGAAKQLRSPWFQYFITYEPSQSLKQLKCAVLAINGSKDLQVEPKMNLSAIEEALQSAPTDDFEVVELPSLNHLFQKATTGLMNEYSQIEETFHPSALELMADWILKHAK